MMGVGGTHAGIKTLKKKKKQAWISQQCEEQLQVMQIYNVLWPSLHEMYISKLKLSQLKAEKPFV